MRQHIHAFCRWAILALLLMGVTGLTIDAQVLTGAIAGTVTDTSGATIAEAKVTVTSEALLSGSQTVLSGANGSYKFLELPPGTYTVRFERPGFRPVVAAGLVINSAVQVTKDATLTLGDVTQEIMVQADAASIDTAHVTSQTVASQQVMEGIPTGRSPWAIANIVAGVATTTYDVGGSSGMQQASLTAHGSNSADQKFMIDGVSVNWPGGGGGSTLMYYDMGMFQEVNYLIGAVPADVSQGGVYMNMITKDGGNKIHGSIFMNGASQGMQSNNVNAALANQLFANLSAAARSKVDLSKIVPGNPVTETYDYNGQVGGAILKDKLWWFTSWRLWATNNLVAGAFNTNGSQAINDNKIGDEMAKISWQANAKNRFSIMYFRNQKNRYHRRNQGSFGDDVTTVLQNQPGYDGHVKWTYVPTPSVVIDSGVALNSGKTPYRYQNNIVPGSISVYDSGTGTVFNAAQYNYLNPCYRFAADSSINYFTTGLGGTHSLRAGFQYSHDGFNQIYLANGDMQGVLINGVASTATIYNTPLNQQKNNMDISAGYVEDTWTVKRFTLNVGVRWERMFGSIPAQVSPAGAFVAARNYAAINGVPNFHNWTPRFGFSWDPIGKGKTVIKGSVNKYMQGLDMNLVNAVNPLGFSTASVPWSDSNHDGVPQQSELNLSAFNGFVGGATTHLDPNLRRPYSWEESFGVQQQLPLDIVLSVTGWHRATINQIGRANLAVPSSAYTPVTINNPLTGGPLVVYNQLASTKGQVNYALTNSRTLNNDYRGLDIAFTRRMARKWMMLGGVTVGRLRGAPYGDLNTTLDDLNNPNSNINRLGELSNDTPVIFKLGGTYYLPLGLVLAGNFQHVTGYPITQQYTVTSAILGQTLTQSSQTMYLAPAGQLRLPGVNLLDMRLSKIFTYRERWKIQPEFDAYNLNNSAAVTSVNTSVNAGALFLNPTNVLSPRLFKVGLRVDF